MGVTDFVQSNVFILGKSVSEKVRGKRCGDYLYPHRKSENSKQELRINWSKRTEKKKKKGREREVKLRK